MKQQKLKWLESQHKSNIKLNLKELWWKTRVTPATEILLQISVVRRYEIPVNVRHVGCRKLTKAKWHVRDTYTERKCACVGLSSSTFAITTN